MTKSTDYASPETGSGSAKAVPLQPGFWEGTVLCGSGHVGRELEQKGQSMSKHCCAVATTTVCGLSSGKWPETGE